MVKMQYLAIAIAKESFTVLVCEHRVQQITIHQAGKCRAKGRLAEVPVLAQIIIGH